MNISSVKWSATILFLLIVLSGCDKLHKLTQFNMDYESDYSYSAGLPINIPVQIFSPDVVTNSDQEFAINDTRKDLIESIKLQQLKLTITSPSGKTFSFLKDVRVYISADGLPETEVANKLNIDNTVGGEVELTVFDVELKEYIKADKFKLKVASTTDELITSNVNVHIYSNFFVDAKILGL
ncbi:MAG: hypothetical protein U0V74_10575 [Chitinophagales bacterium]